MTTPYTPVETHGRGLAEHGLERLVQFHHPDKLLAVAGLPGANALSAEAAASVLGVDTQRYGAALETIHARACQAARELSRVAHVVDAVASLPLRADDVIVAAGDSLVDDLQSWAEILPHLLATLGAPSVRVINAGISGDTTSALVARMGEVLRLRPQWLVIMIGLNDARRHGDERAPMILSDQQTTANLLELARRTVTATPYTHLLWITPPPIIPDLIAGDPWLRERGVRWRSEDVRGKARLFAALSEPVLDLQTLIGTRPDPALLLDDGLHLSLAGQALVTEHLLSLWAEHWS